MNKTNWQNEFQLKLNNFSKNNSVPKVLLHCCCAPCASGCIERLKEGAQVVLYFYNPNMCSIEEYEKRKQEIYKLASFFSVEVICEEHLKEDFYYAVQGLENCPERGERCSACFHLRLSKTAQIARLKGFDYFATTLTLSPLKNAELINTIGQKIEKENKINYLPSDFKKKNGLLRSIELSKQLNLYRQNFCGCEFSKKSTFYR